MHRITRSGPLALLATGSVLLAAGWGTPASATDSPVGQGPAANPAVASSAATGLPAPPSSDPFYRPPAGYASTTPGAILKSRRLPAGAANVLGTLGAASATQLLYRTTGVHREPTVTVTTVLTPAHPAPGPRRLVAYQVAEDSLTTNCAPSYLLRLATPTGTLPAEAGNVAGALARGWDVAVSDYEGSDSDLLIGDLEGRQTLDGIRAAEQLPAADLPGTATQVGLQGYSGGSVPTIWAGLLAPQYAPELNLVGLASGGVDADPGYITAHIDGSPAFGGVMLALVAYNRAYPELRLPTILNKAGRAVAAKLAVDGYGCAGGVTPLGAASAKQYTRYATSQALAADPRLTPIVDRLNAVTRPAPTVPSYLYNTVHDEIMRVRQVDALNRHWCLSGTRVVYDRSDSGDHTTGFVAFSAAATPYLASRFDGSRAPTTC